MSDQAGAPESPAAVFDRLRPRLLGIAYRMLGSAVEAEDVVQDAWLRWQAADHATVADPTGFLVTTASRLALNAARTARARRETYVGPWLPEPVATGADAELRLERDESLQIAMLLLLERLSPDERAAYVLREAFDYSHREVAAILTTTEANARQIFARARKHVAGERAAPVDRGEHQRLLAAFVDAARDGDHDRLERLFAEDVVSYSDGGGKVNAAKVPIAGRQRLARFLVGVAAKFWDGARFAAVEVNGQPGVRITLAGGGQALVALDVGDAGITRMFWVLNPEKLGFVGRQ